jgi:hypothetical protein
MTLAANAAMVKYAPEIPLGLTHAYSRAICQAYLSGRVTPWMNDA